MDTPVIKKKLGLKDRYAIVDVWKKKLTEFEEAQAGKDSQVVQGYAHLSKIQEIGRASCRERVSSPV